MRPLHIHVLQHVPFEGLGCIANWISENGYVLTTTAFYESFRLPNVSDVDWIIIMGGPMSIHDENEYPWLRLEKTFIKQALDQNKVILGVCLGAQLIANVLGSKVYQNKEKEIGWFPITQVQAEIELLKGFEKSFPVLHWHGETFDIPKQAVHLFRSEACENQAFLYKNNVLGFQFHIEATPESLIEMAENCRSDIQEQQYVQSYEELTSNQMHILNNNTIMHELLNRLAATIKL